MSTPALEPDNIFANPVQDPFRDERVEDILDGANALANVPHVPAYSPTQGMMADVASLIPMVANMSRDHDAMLQAAQRVGGNMGGRGYYAWKQGGKEISGPTIWLMEALRIEWGYILAGVAVDHIAGNEVHIMATVVDLLNCNVIKRPWAGGLKPPPAKFANSDEESDRWRNMQLSTCYSKATRVALEHAMPEWFWCPAVRAAMDADRQGLLKGKSIDQATKDAIRAFEVMHKVTVEQIENHLGLNRDQWAIQEIVDLRNLSASLRAGETTVAIVFADKPQTTPESTSGLSDIVDEEQKLPPEPDPPAEPSGNPELEEKRVLAALIVNLERQLGTEGWKAARNQAGISHSATASARNNLDKLQGWLEALRAQQSAQGE